MHLILPNSILILKSFQDTLKKDDWASTIGRFVHIFEEDREMQSWKVLADTRRDSLASIRQPGNIVVLDGV